MSTSAPKEPVSGVIDDLEQKLTAARKEKTLARVPALRRLRNVVRFHMVIGGLFQLFMPLRGVSLRLVHNEVNAMGPNLISVSAFCLYAVIMCVDVALYLLLLFAYARFFKQFRENHLHDIEDTTAMILRIWNLYLLLTIPYAILPTAIGIFISIEVSAQSINNMVGMLVGALVMYFVIRHY